MKIWEEGKEGKGAERGGGGRGGRSMRENVVIQTHTTCTCIVKQNMTNSIEALKPTQKANQQVTCLL